MTTRAPLNTDLPIELKAELVQQALDNGRTMKKELETILQNYFKAKREIEMEYAAIHKRSKPTRHDKRKPHYG